MYCAYLAFVEAKRFLVAELVSLSETTLDFPKPRVGIPFSARQLYVILRAPMNYLF